MDADKQERKELAKKMAMQRSKTVNRRPLSSGKESAEQGQPRLFKRGNMLRITGEDANGWEIDPSTVQWGAFIFFIAVILLHVVTKGTPYRSINPLVKEYYEPPIVNAAAAAADSVMNQTTIN